MTCWHSGFLHVQAGRFSGVSRALMVTVSCVNVNFESPSAVESTSEVLDDVEDDDESPVLALFAGG